jgi:hypothetical protein
MGGFKQEDIDKVMMWPNQGFEPLVSISLLVQDLSAVKDSPPPILEDRVAR